MLAMIQDILKDMDIYSVQFQTGRGKSHFWFVGNDGSIFWTSSATINSKDNHRKLRYSGHSQGVGLFLVRKCDLIGCP